MAGVNLWRNLGLWLAAMLFVLARVAAPSAEPARQSTAIAGIHEGVASCAGSTCHGRQVSSGLIVRQSELVTWQDYSSSAGAHSRAWRVLTEPRAQAIADRLGLGPAQKSPTCLGCHADPVPANHRGEKFHLSDGVGCEACHGGSGGWLASHYAIGASHASNVAQGMVPLDNPRARAAVCLDCHFGSSRPGQFVSHRLMSAGHPRLSFELDLFTELQRHHDTDADYAQRKQIAGGVKTWAVGQSMALERSLTLYGDAAHGQEGSFPEPYFFDCHSCHRPISDAADARPQFQPNPGRPIPHGMAPYNDENMILLSAAAKAAAPDIAPRFDADVRAFHLAIAKDRPSAVRAADKLAATSRSLQTSFASHGFGRAETFSMLEAVLNEAEAGRYTDYQGGVQAVMAVDTLLSALVNSGQADRAAAAAIRPDINAAYAAVRDPNGFRVADFRAALERVHAAIRRLK